MTVVNRLPFPVMQLSKTDGTPAVSWVLTFYLSGTSTLANVYTAVDLTGATNAIVLNAYGMPDVDIFLDPDVNYKLVIADDAAAPVFTFNNVRDFARRAVAHFTIYAGNPNGNVAGTAGVVGGTPADAIFDTTNGIIWICTTTGTAGTAVWTNVSSALSGAIVFTGVLSPASFSTQQDNYNPTDLATASTIRLNPGAAASMTGLAGGSNGRRMTLFNTSTTYGVTLRNQNTSSSVANRFLLGGDVIIEPQMSVSLQYDSLSGRWILAAPPFSFSTQTLAQCQLTKSGANLSLGRLGGKFLFIGGSNQEIPAAGITLAPPATTATLYYIYAYMSTFTMTLEYSTTAYAVDATYGHVIKSGDSSRTLVGLAYTLSSAWIDSATQRYVRSYHNDPGLNLLNGFTADRTTASATYVELNTEIRIEFLVWTGEIVRFGFNTGVFSAATSGVSVATSIGINGTTAEDVIALGVAVNNAGTAQLPLSGTIFKSGMTEGYNYATLLGKTSAGTVGWMGGAASLRTTLRGLLRR